MAFRNVAGRPGFKADIGKYCTLRKLVALALSSIKEPRGSYCNPNLAWARFRSIEGLWSNPLGSTVA